MISIIICSTQPSISSQLSVNIEKTIGENEEYEIVCINNHNNCHSIFSAYAEGINRAKGDYLCFMHQDIIFHSKNWGKKIRKAFSDKQIGMIGVIGTTFFSSAMAAWWNAPLLAKKGKIIQGNTTNGIYKTYAVKYDNYTSDDFVIAVDGLWMCIRKCLFKERKISFDYVTYSGFHFYDMDISFQVIEKGYKILIVDIDIEHKSLGNVNDSFYEERINLQKKWGSFMPFCCDKKNKDKFVNELDEKMLKFMYYSDKRIKQLTDILNMPLHKFSTKIYLMQGKQF